ncbi:putative cytokinetic ring protein SteA [Bacillus piscicola]|uniref:putative cytokinetic ring protein SteA n=1 Tax=Bacillus piscicola TaxID=1632684 RepID=UPI001F0991B5
MGAIRGQAFYHSQTKILTQLIRAKQIAVLSHEDIDVPAAESLIRKEVKAVINNKTSMSGNFLHEGVKKLLSHDIHVYDTDPSHEVGAWVHGRNLVIKDEHLYVQYANKNIKLALLQKYNFTDITFLEQQAFKNLEHTFTRFCHNSFSHAEVDLPMMLECWNKWQEGETLNNKDVLIVIRGAGYEQDLYWVKKHLLNRNICTIAVDGAADGMRALGITPDYIVGDMDSVSTEALHSGVKLLVHRDASGRALGMERIKKRQLTAETITFVGLSEDAAITLALKEGARHIFLLGGQRGMNEYLSKGRQGMGSSLLMRMLAGGKIIDLKGIHVLLEKEPKKHRYFQWFHRMYQHIPFIHAKFNKETRGMKA